MENSVKNILDIHGLRRTPFRLKVLKIFLDSEDQALNNASLESQLPDADRITLYRTIKSFEKAGIIHQAIDGSNESKYALCNNDCTEHNHKDNHAHFLCNTCGKTFCIENVMNSTYSLPVKFTMDKVHVAITGICGNCN